MSWASRRRTAYGIGVFLFLAIVIGVPLAIWIYDAPTCFDGKQNQTETTVDKGGPCLLIDERTLQPAATLWTRAFQVRGGLYSAVAYVENPNTGAGVESARYQLRLYDDRNVLVAEREGTTFIMPGGITPIYEGGIDTGNRAVARAFLEFTSSLVWKHMENPADVLVIGNRAISAIDAAPRLEANVKNTSVAVIQDPEFVAIVFDTAGNAFAASATTLTRLAGNEEGRVVFTWPDPFPKAPGRIDVLPLLPPLPLRP
jgi:hypothetical protein